MGDALGTTLEFQTPGSSTPLNEIIGGGPFRLKLGEGNDDSVKDALSGGESCRERVESRQSDEIIFAMVSNRTHGQQQALFRYWEYDP